MFILLIIVTVIIAFAYDYYLHHSRFGQLIDKIPGPKTIPFLGNLFTMLVTPEKLWYVFDSLSNQYYPKYKIWNFSKVLVFIRHPDDLEIILNNTTHIEKGDIYNVFRPWLNDGLFTSTGVKWHSRRKILTPAFHFNILRQFVEILTEEGERMTQKLKNFGGPIEMDVLPFASEHMLNAICETAMGTSLHNLGEAQKEYRNAVRQICQLFVHRMTRVWLHPNLTFSLSSVGRFQKKVLQNLHGFTENIIAERKLYHERTSYKYLQKFENDEKMKTDDAGVYGAYDFSFDSVKKRRLAMLDLLIAASRDNQLSDSDIREEVDTFTFEGHDTTSIAISFTLLLLAEHKDIQLNKTCLSLVITDSDDRDQKLLAIMMNISTDNFMGINIQDRVREEINRVMEQHEEKWTLSSLQDLSYLDRCLKESLRLYPSAHSISRVTATDVQLRDSLVIPSRTTIMLNIYGVHRDPNFWPNPDVFDPDRFLPEKIQGRHPYSYLPFSAGPRNCIGQRFALLELKAMIAPLVRSFYLEPIDHLKNMRILYDIVLRPSHALNVRFIPIEVA